MIFNRGNLIVKKQSLLSQVFSRIEATIVYRKPFKSPNSNGYHKGLAQHLQVHKWFVPSYSSRSTSTPIRRLEGFQYHVRRFKCSTQKLVQGLEITNNLKIPSIAKKDIEEENVTLPPRIEPLVLWQPNQSEEGVANFVQIEVDPLLVRFLRPHQREGVQFMFQCVSGLRGKENFFGCILADDMGLGKTLQSITLLDTLLHQGFDGKPMVKKAIIVTPTSLVGNWEAEIKKWVGERVQLVSLCRSTRDNVVSGIDSFTDPSNPLQVLIVSYETLRIHLSKFSHCESCDLLICDEAHRLRNNLTLTNRALDSLSCKRRILLSGTPMQNNLNEFFAMVDFANPGILGNAKYCRRYYEKPIMRGMESTATEEEKKLGAERAAELRAEVNQFILRRTNELLSNHLPPKLVEVVCCQLTPLQTDLYHHLVQSKDLHIIQVRQAINEEERQRRVLSYITALKKLCNHPKLIYDTIKSGRPEILGFQECIRFFPPEMFSGRSGSWTGDDGAWVELSGKMHVLARLLSHLHQRTNDRIVLVSNYTQTLDLFAQLCRERGYPYLRLDGTTSISKRQKLVDRFNDPSKDEFAFLLSSKAGGCGLNLIGGNRLVLFDPDWNPANDKQAAARIWRDGQKKRVYIYRLLSTGTIEEKVYQRQMSKELLQKVILQKQTDGLTTQAHFLSMEDPPNIFPLFENVRSEIHWLMNCVRCQNHNDKLENIEEGDANQLTNTNFQSHQESRDIGGFADIAGCLHKLKSSEKQIGAPLEEDLGSWGHHFLSTSVPDTIFQAAAGDEVTFVFTNQVDGKLVPIESTSRRVQGSEEKDSELESFENFNKKAPAIGFV